MSITRNFHGHLVVVGAGGHICDVCKKPCKSSTALLSHVRSTHTPKRSRGEVPHGQQTLRFAPSASSVAAVEVAAPAVVPSSPLPRADGRKRNRGAPLRRRRTLDEWRKNSRTQVGPAQGDSSQNRQPHVVCPRTTLDGIGVVGCCVADHSWRAIRADAHFSMAEDWLHAVCRWSGR